jgi:hypothetical protein
MRARINANRIDISTVVKEIKQKESRYREVKDELLKEICKRDNVRISEAKKILKQGVAWSLLVFEIGMLNK